MLTFCWHVHNWAASIFHTNKIISFGYHGFVCTRAGSGTWGQRMQGEKRKERRRLSIVGLFSFIAAGYVRDGHSIVTWGRLFPRQKTGVLLVRHD